MNPHSKLRQEQQHESELRQNEQSQSAQEFESVDEMIRLDANQTVPPPSIAERLKESIAQEPPPAQPWWKRLFGGK
jgi:hypothetical protein